jgi:hypothetical protein
MSSSEYIRRKYIPPVSIAGREKHFALVRETGAYTLGNIVSEVKPHKVFGTEIDCNIRRGTIIATYKFGKSATIMCECGTNVKEGI